MQLHKTLYQLQAFPCRRRKKIFRNAAKDGLLQDKSEQDIIPKSVVLGLLKKDLIIQIFTQRTLFSIDYIKNNFELIVQISNLYLLVKLQH